MGLFGKKQTKAELEAAREAQIDKTFKRFDDLLVQLTKKKRYLLSKVVEAKSKGLTQQYQEARRLLNSCMAHEKRVMSMQMRLELAIQDRDLAALQHSFVECVSDISTDITGSVANTKSKKAKNKYIKALYDLNKQNDKVDDLLKTADTANSATVDNVNLNQFDTEIDSMIAEAEFNGGYSVGPNRIR